MFKELVKLNFICIKGNEAFSVENKHYQRPFLGGLSREQRFVFGHPFPCGALCQCQVLRAHFKPAGVLKAWMSRGLGLN